MYVGLPKYLVNWESESESWHLLFSCEFSPSRGLSFSPHFANMCHRSWGGLNLKERLRLVFYYLCWYIPLSLWVHASEGFKKLPWNTLLLAVAISPVRYIDMTYRLSIYRHFWKISISISISIWSYLKISISISISIRQLKKYRYRYRYGDFGKYRYRYWYR